MPIEIPRGLPFAVDTWTPASSLKRHRFLTHAHRDHLAGIASTATAAAYIYASRLTILFTLRIFPQLDRAAFVELEVGAPPLRVPDPDGDFTVTAFDANHCPGAVMFLFEGAFGAVLHTGDCRLTPDCLHALPPSLLPTPSHRRIDYVFLDCTFARCPLPFPTKADSIRQVTNCIRKFPDAPAVYLACDMLGQEDVLVEVSRAFGAKIYVDPAASPDCRHTLSHVAPEVLTDDPAASRFRVMEAFPRLSERATEILVLARASGQPEPLIIRPSSQWYAYYEAPNEAALHRRPVLTEPTRDEFGVWHVCLSMHSSREELEQALGVLQPRWVVSTTPPCMALDLTYVKKHCSLSSFGSDDPIWKLLGITDGMSTVAGGGSPQPSAVSVEAAIEKSEITCSAEEVRSDSDDATQVIEALAEAEPTPERIFEIRVEPPVTLFGSARFGLLQNEPQLLWKDEHYHQSAEVTSGDVETEAMDDSATTEAFGLSKDGMPDETVKVIEITEVAAANKHNSATGADLLIQHGKSGSKVDVINLAEDRSMLVQSSSTRSELCKDDKFAEVVKGSGEAETEAQQHGLSVHSDSRTICRSRVTEQGENVTKVVEISAVQITVSAKSKIAEDGIAPLEISKKLEQDSDRARDASTVIGSLKGLNPNLRRLYRSMNVSVPRPLPSLVELMGASKRSRVSQTLQL